MSKKLLCCGAVAALALVAASTGPMAALASSQTVSPKHHGAQLRHMIAGLDLTQDQKNQIKAILVGSRATIEPLVKELYQNGLALRTATEASPVDQDKINSVASDNGNVASELTVDAVKVKAQIDGVLTADQLAKIQAHEAKICAGLSNQSMSPQIMAAGTKVATKIFAKLGFTDDQKQQSFSILVNGYTSAAPAVQQIIHDVKAIKAAGDSGDISTSATDIGKQVTALTLTGAAIKVQFLQIMTPAQVTQVETCETKAITIADAGWKYADTVMDTLSQ